MTEGKVTILVVDDEEYIRKLLQRILEDAGYDVLMAGSGQEALDKLMQAENQEPQLILLDIMMPGLNGFQSLELTKIHHLFLRVKDFWCGGIPNMPEVISPMVAACGPFCAFGP